MSDYQLIEFLLKCPFLDNQLSTKEKISVGLLKTKLDPEDFKELEKTQRSFKILGGELQFEPREFKQKVA